MSTARHAIDSTFRRVLSYAAEIIISIILLVIICIPLVFALPMWLEHVIFGIPRTELSINLIAWFGYDGTLWLTLLLGLVSVSLGYLYILKLKPGSTSRDTDEEEESEPLEEEYETAVPGDSETAEVASEDRGSAKEILDLDESEESLEDIEEDEEEIEEDE